MKKQRNTGGFQTHIPEPRWQQIASVIVAGAFVIIWLWLAFWHK